MVDSMKYKKPRVLRRMDIDFKKKFQRVSGMRYARALARIFWG